MGNITIQGDLTGDVPGGEVGGASNLTTVGAIPYVSASGILNQDPTALFWDAANNRLGVGTNSPAAPLVVSDAGNAMSFGSVAGAYVGLAAGNGALSPNNFFITSNGGVTAVNTNSTSGHIYFGVVNAEKMRLAGSTGNLLIGTTTDSNFKLDVAASGSAGTARFYGGAGVSDKTNVRIQDGGGNVQSDRLLEAVNANNTVVYFIVNPNQNISTTASGFQTLNQRAAMVNSFGNGGGFILGDIYRLSWSSTASVVSGSYDLSLSRASAGVLQVGDGGSNANGVVSLTRSQHAGVLVAALPAAAAGNAGSIQYVTDANATTIGSTVAGGGANKVMVWSDGAAWKIFAS